jgi:hypothetical protein
VGLTGGSHQGVVAARVTASALGAGESRPKGGEREFPFLFFSYLALHSTPRMLFTNQSTTNKKIMVWHDATTEEKYF